MVEVAARAEQTRIKRVELTHEISISRGFHSAVYLNRNATFRMKLIHVVRYNEASGRRIKRGYANGEMMKEYSRPEHNVFALIFLL